MRMGDWTKPTSAEMLEISAGRVSPISIARRSLAPGFGLTNASEASDAGTMSSKAKSCCSSSSRTPFDCACPTRKIESDQKDQDHVAGLKELITRVVEDDLTSASIGEGYCQQQQKRIASHRVLRKDVSQSQKKQAIVQTLVSLSFVQRKKEVTMLWV